MEVCDQPRLQLRLLGGCELQTTDGRALTPPGKKLRALLACLGLRPGAAWSRDRLIGLFWADRGEEQARGSLRQALTELRRALGEPSPLQAERETVALDPAMVSVDAVELERLAKEGDLTGASALYRGDLLEGINLPDAGFADWLLVERTRLHDLAVDVLTRLLATQSGEAAIETAQRLLQLDPAREPAHRTLMRLYAAQGDRAQALRQYQACRDALQRELGVKPEAQTDELLKEIETCARSGSPPKAGPGPPPSPTAPAPERPRPAREPDSGLGSPTAGIARRLEIAGVQRRAIALALLVVIAAGVGAAWYWYAQPPPTVSATAANPDAALGIPVLHVQPFQNLTGDPSFDDVVIGIAEDLQNLLWSFPEFQVVSGTPDMVPANGVAEVTQRFDAAFVIAGSVRRSGFKSLISAQLIDGARGTQLWSHRFEQLNMDPVGFEIAVASRVTDVLAGYSGKIREAYERVAWSKAEAELSEYDYYVRGHGHHHRFTKEAVMRARDIYQAGLDRYPDSALLRIKIGFVHGNYATRGWGQDARAELARMRELVAEAGELLAARRKSRFEEWHLQWISAYAYQSERDFGSCLAAARAAVRLNPYDAFSRGSLVYALAECGDPDEAVEWAKESIRREPEGPRYTPERYSRALSWALYLADRCREAVTVIAAMTAKPPLILAACQARLGQLDAARSTIAAFVEDQPNWTLRNEADFPFPMIDPLHRRWLDDLRAAGLPEE